MYQVTLATDIISMKTTGRYWYLHLVRVRSPPSVDIKNSKATPTTLQPTVKISFALARPPPLAEITTLVPTSIGSHQTFSQALAALKTPTLTSDDFSPSLYDIIKIIYKRRAVNTIRVLALSHRAVNTVQTLSNNSIPPPQAPPHHINSPL